MPGDELAAELLTAVLDADPVDGSLFGFPGYDDSCPTSAGRPRRAHARSSKSIATRAEQAPDDGLAETELQTLDFVRCLARGMAGAAQCPSSSSPSATRSPLRSATCWPRCRRSARHRGAARGLPGAVARPPGHARHGGATPRGRRAAGPDRGGPARRGRHRAARPHDRRTPPWVPCSGPTRARLRRAVSVAIDDHARPALAAYRDALRTTVLPPPATTSTRASASSPTARRCTGPWPGCTRP